MPSFSSRFRSIHANWIELCRRKNIGLLFETQFILTLRLLNLQPLQAGLWSLATNLDRNLHFCFYKPSGSLPASQRSEWPHYFHRLLIYFQLTLKEAQQLLHPRPAEASQACDEPQRKKSQHTRGWKFPNEENFSVNEQNQPHGRHLDSPLLQAAAGRQWSLSVHRQQQGCGKDAAGDDSVQRESHVWSLGVIVIFWW